MMCVKKISMSDFEKLCIKNEGALHILSSENQKKDNFYGMILKFKHVSVSYTPDTVVYSNECGSIWFQSVKGIFADKQQSVIGQRYKIEYGNNECAVFVMQPFHK